MGCNTGRSWCHLPGPGGAGVWNGGFGRTRTWSGGCWGRGGSSSEHRRGGGCVLRAGPGGTRELLADLAFRASPEGVAHEGHRGLSPCRVMFEGVGRGPQGRGQRTNCGMRGRRGSPYEGGHGCQAGEAPPVNECVTSTCSESAWYLEVQGCSRFWSSRCHAGDAWGQPH